MASESWSQSKSRGFGQVLGRGSRARGLGPDLASSPGHCVALPLLFSGAHYNSSGHKTIGSYVACVYRKHSNSKF